MRGQLFILFLRFDLNYFKDNRFCSFFMRIAFIARSTLYRVHGGITVHVLETAKQLRKLGVDVSVILTDEKPRYSEFDLLHFFDIPRPANILHHVKRSNKPFVITPILIDYSEYDKQHRKGFTGSVFQYFSPAANEYIKTVSRWLLRKDRLPAKSYLWKGQQRSMQYILRKAAMVLPNSTSEYLQLNNLYPLDKPYTVVPNGIDDQLFRPDYSVPKDPKLVLCVARFEGLKNQLNLIKALNNTEFTVLLAGDTTPNQQQYYRQCREIAAGNIQFLGKLSQEELLPYYKKAKVHILPSWFETCGLSSLEAAAMGSNVVVNNKGFTRDYFGDEAFYCDPGNPASIYKAVQQAAISPSQKSLQTRVLTQFTWRQAAIHTLEAYKRVLSGKSYTRLIHIKTSEQ
jgi:glycosyltransferase involved in cell wall biosynthesis